MNKISKEKQAQIDALRTRYTEARAALDTAQSDANEAIAYAIEKVNEKVADLNAIIEEANSLREEIASDAQSYYDEKSEAWQDGERGSAYSDFIQRRAWVEACRVVEDRTRKTWGAPEGAVTRRHFARGADRERGQAAEAIQRAAWIRCGKPREGRLTEEVTVRDFWCDLMRLARLDLPTPTEKE